MSSTNQVCMICWMPPTDLLNGTFLWKMAEHFSNGDREVKDQIKTRRRFFCNFFVARPKYFLVGCFRWHGQQFRPNIEIFAKFFAQIFPKENLGKIFFFENFFGHVSAKNKTKKKIFFWKKKFFFSKIFFWPKFFRKIFEFFFCKKN